MPKLYGVSRTSLFALILEEVWAVWQLVLSKNHIGRFALGVLR